MQNDEVDSEELTMEQKVLRFVQRTGRETAGRCAAIVVSQPLHVIAIRTMAEFVGQDGEYT